MIQRESPETIDNGGRLKTKITGGRAATFTKESSKCLKKQK